MMRTQRKLKGQRSESNLWSNDKNEREVAEKRWKLVENSLPVVQIDFNQASASIEEEGNRNKPETNKDAKCQTTEFDYMFQTSTYQTPHMDFFDIEDKVRLYTGLPST